MRSPSKSITKRITDAESELNLPPGFRFHPTDEELIVHYLRSKSQTTGRPSPPPIIADVDLYKHDPWELPDMALFGTKEWYFFTPRDRKYPNGSRPNRVTGNGYWKATGAEKEYYIGCACDELYTPPSAYFSLFGLTAQAQFFGGVFEKVGIEPQVKRIGKYKSAAEQLTRKNISEENREVLTTVLDNIYGNWVETVSQSKGKKKEDIESFINDGVYQVEKLKEDGWITDIKYEDEVTSMLKKKLGIAEKKKLPIVTYKKYSRVGKWSLGLSGGKNQIAVIRASGGISRVGGSFFSPSSGIVVEKFIEKIHKVRESKRYKAVIIRIDSPGGDVLASDLMWREISLLAESKPVIASMVDLAASGGYYMAMAAQTIVSENLTLTGSIGVFKNVSTTMIIQRGPVVDFLIANQNVKYLK